MSNGLRYILVLHYDFRFYKDKSASFWLALIDLVRLFRRYLFTAEDRLQ